jgi:hypothetical protein
MTLKTLGMGIAKVLTKDQKKWKKLFHKKKNLDWSDVKKSYKIFTKKK